MTSITSKEKTNPSTTTDKTPTQEPVHYVAVDIAKSTLQVQDELKAFETGNNSSGLGQLLKYLRTCKNPLVVFEATGGYERAMVEFLGQAGVAMTMVNPALVRAFARSEGMRAKTDPIDGKMILAFAKSKALKSNLRPCQQRSKLGALLDRRGHLVEQLAREKNRRQNSETAILLSIRRIMKVLDKEIAKIEAEIEKLIKSEPHWVAQIEVMTSVKGVGQLTAWTLLAYLGELTEIGRNQAAALAGVAPFNRDSGKFTGKRFIQGGRAKVRSCLYMAASSAAVWNPVIAPYVARLRERGKPYKCAIVAAMRKLLIHLQSLLRKMNKKADFSPC
jgi:transposase